MAITGLYNTSFDIGDEVLYLDPNNKDIPYVNGVVRAVVPIAGGPDMLNVLLDNGVYVYHNASRFVKVYKMHTAKIKPLFKKGDRVIWDDTAFNTKRKATVIACCDDEYYTIEVDSKYSKYNTFNVHVDNLEIMKEDNMTFKVGDRVRYNDNGHLDHGKYATIKSIKNKNNGSVWDYVIELEPSGQILHTTKDNLIFAASQVPNTDKDYAVKCAKWFKSAYAAITKAGGVPEIVIDSIPVDVLDNLIRNDLHLEYKK